MAFKFAKSLSGENCSTIESRNCDIDIQPDVVVTLTAGKAVLATAKPSFVSASKSGNGKIAVYPVLPNHVYETEFSADAAAIKEGDKVTVAATGDKVTSTTASGVATVWQMFGTAIGSKVHIRFE